MKDKVFYIVSFGLLGGVLLHSFFSVNFYVLFFVLFISLFLFLLSYFIIKNKLLFLFFLFIFASGLGMWRFHSFVDYEHFVFEGSVGNNVSYNGLIVSDPETRETNQRFVVEVSKGEESTKILVSTDFGQDFEYGDFLKIEGKLKKPENFLGENGREFDYVNYLAKDGVFYTMSYADVEIWPKKEGGALKRGLYSVKNKFLEKINYSIKKPESLLMAGLILGERSEFSGELTQDFVDTGTIHIVALSGYNVTIISEWFMKLFAFLPAVFSVWAGILAIVLFVVMTGAGATAVRAGIMASLVLVARFTGRTYEVGRILVLTAVFMVLWNPMILAFDVSFQLSFIATVAVIFLTPRVEKYFKWITPRFGMRDVVSVTFAAYIFVLPFILYKMGNLSLAALPANILILPLIPLTMVFGFLTAFSGFISSFLSLLFGYFSNILLSYELWVVELFAQLSFASFTINKFPLLLTIGIYVFFIYFLFGKDIKKFFK